MIKKYVSFLLCTLIISCTFYVNEENSSVNVPLFYSDKEEIILRTECDYDKFKKITICKSPIFKNTIKSNSEQKLQYSGNQNISMFYRIIKNNSNILPQLYFVYRSDNWAFFREAYDENGNKLNFVEINGGDDVITGRYTVRVQEQFALNVDDKFIKKYEKTGVEIKFVGIKRDSIFYVHPVVLRVLKEQLK